MRTKQQWIEALSKMRRNVYVNGEKFDRTDDIQMLTIDTIGITYDEALKPESADLLLAKSHLTGETISRFTHVHQSIEDLHKKQDMTRFICCKVGGCIMRCMGTDAINALNAVSFEADKENNGTTEYHKNFLKWLKRFQEEDLMGCCAQSDVKGNRKKHPSQQPDPDVYLRVVEKKSDGIVVRGCKVHNTVASVADEIIVVPTRTLRPEEKDWAVAFALPGDWEGIKQVVTVHEYRERECFPRGFTPGGTDSYTIFEDVFVPWERVFLCGETQHGGILALLFALFHRHSYSGCKPALGDILLGTAALAAEYNGIEKASHVRDKLSEIILTTELGYAAGFTASELGKPELYIPGLGSVPYGPGGFIPDSIYSNVGRCLTGQAVFREAEIICDISGGIPATFPYEKDFLNPETKDLLYKYTRRNQDVPVENQAQLWRFVGDMLCSATGALWNVAAYHGGGSPIMEQIAITSQYDIEKRKQMVKEIAGIKE